MNMLFGPKANLLFEACLASLVRVIIEYLGGGSVDKHAPKNDITF